jgi:hypothetical protein
MAAIPLLGIVLILANVLGFASAQGFDAVLLNFTLPSGAPVALTTGMVLILLGLALLYVEVLKATRTGASSILDHALSMAVFIVALVELLIVKRLGHPVFMVVLLMCFIDVLAGFTVTIAAARRDVGFPSEK